MKKIKISLNTKKNLLIILNIILSCLFFLTLLIPICSFNKIYKNNLITKEGQRVEILYFVETISLNEEKIDQARLDLTSKTVELSNRVLKNEITLEQSKEILLNSQEKNRYDVYNFATQENLTLIYGISEGNLIKKLNIISYLFLLFYIIIIMLIFINILFLFIKKNVIIKSIILFSFLLILIYSILVVLLELFVKIENNYDYIFKASVNIYGYISIIVFVIYFFFTIFLYKYLKKRYLLDKSR